MSVAIALVLACVATWTAAAVPHPYPASVVVIPELVRRVARQGGLRALCERGLVCPAKPHWRRFVRRLCAGLVLENKTGVRVTVVGAGPVGLLSALTAHAAGAEVTVLEKRRTRRRRMWLDLTDGAWGQTVRMLESWGVMDLAEELGALRGEKLSFDKSQVIGRAINLQCRLLERFLAMIAALLGIDIRYGQEWLATDDTLTDVLIGADGARSGVRAALGIREEVVEKAQQDSVLVSFAECPQVEELPLSPWEFSEHDARISMVYVRFSAGQCELQILLRAAASDVGRLAEEAEQFALAWVVVQLALPGVFESEEAFRKTVGSLQLLRWRVSRSLDTTVCRDASCTRIGVLVGDAVFPAHFRLGIGINSAVDAMRNLRVLLRSPRSQWREQVELKQAVDDELMGRVWRHQLRTVWLEAVCEAHVFQELPHPGIVDEDDLYVPPADPGPLHAVRVHPGSQLDMRLRGRERMRPRLFSVVLSMDEAMAACRQRVGPPPWEQQGDPADEAVRYALRAPKDNVAAVLGELDAFADTSAWLMTVGPVKGRLLRAAAERVRPDAVALELGTYIGYGALLLTEALPPGTLVLTVEPDARRARLARRLLRHAGRLGQVRVLEGTLGEVMEQVRQAAGSPGLGLVFIDHKKDRYLPDLRLLEDAPGLLRPGTIVVADNVLTPGAPDFRAHLHEHAERYDTVEHHTFVEYSEEMPDVVTVSLVK
jgi:catechol O-methyltransferase